MKRLFLLIISTMILSASNAEGFIDLIGYAVNATTGYKINTETNHEIYDRSGTIETKNDDGWQIITYKDTSKIPRCKEN